MIGIIDYNAGNIRSVAHALDAIGAAFQTAKTPKELNTCDRFIFPGVGDAAYAMKHLRSTGFDSFLKDKTSAGVPILGICLGSQIIFDYSEEGNTQCLGLVSGSIRHFSTVWDSAALSSLKIPHMGWNDISFRHSTQSDPLFAQVPDHTDFYFVHSYLICPENEDIILAAANYGCIVPAAIRSGSIWALQFHPEKSGSAGLQILRNFAAMETNPC